MECYGAGAGRLPARSDCPEHWAVHDVGRGAGGHGQFAMVRGVLPHLAESQRGCAQSAVAVAEREGTGGKSFPTGEGILGGHRHRTRCLLYKTLLGAPVEGCVQEEGERCYLARDHLPRRPEWLDAWDQFVWPPSAAVPLAVAEVEQYGYHRWNAVDLGRVQGHRQRRGLFMYGTGPHL